MWKYEIPKMWIEHKFKNISESEPVQMKTLTRLYPGVRQQSWHRGCYLPLSYSPVEPRVSSMFSDLRQVFCFYFTQQMSIYYLIFYRNVRVLLVKQDSLITFNMKVKVKSAVCSDTVMKAWGQFLPTKIYTSAWKRCVRHNKVFCESTGVNMCWRKEVRWAGGRKCRVVSVQI